MASKWCVIVIVLWGTIFSGVTLSYGSDTKLDWSVRKSWQAGNSESETSDSASASQGLSLSDRVRNMKINAHRIRRESESSLMLKVKLSNGSYLYRKVATPKGETGSAETKTVPLTRVARGYKNSKKGKGYGYKKGYVYTTPLPPLAESQEENDSDYVLPSETPPPDSSADRDFRLTTTTPRLDPWDIRDSVPGEPGKDYQVHSSIPQTNFTCEGKTPGFYADPQAGCQVFHRCTDDPWYTGQVRVTMDSFLCPNGSLFNQQIFSCDWWGNVNCEQAKDFYQLNEQIGQLEETEAGTVQYVQFTGVRVPPPPGQKRKAPRIIPKSQRGPLEEKYRTKHRDGHGNGNGNEGSQGLSVSNPEDPDGLLNDFGSDDVPRSFSAFSATESSRDRDRDLEDKEESSQNIDEVSARPPKAKKSSRKLKSKKSKKKSKKAKTTTTTTTTAAPEEEDDEEANDDDEDDEEEDDEDGDEEDEEETAATNNKGAQGLIVNRPDGETGQPPSNLEPPFKGDPVDKERSGTTSDGVYIPPSTEGPTYIPPTKEPQQEGYSYPKPDAYLPPNKEYLSGTSPPTATYLPPTSNPNSGTPDSYYRKPPQGYGTPPNNAYLPPQQNNAYLPPQQNNNAYLPPQQNNAQPNNAYLPPQNQGYSGPAQQPNNAYLPPQQNNNAYLPPQQNNAYLPPQQNNAQPNNAYLPPQNQGYSGPPQNQQPNNAYLPPQGGYSSAPQPANSQYLPPTTQQPNNQYLPPKQGGYSTTPTPPNNAYLPPQNQGYSGPAQQPNNAYLPPQGGYSTPSPPNNAYLPPQNQGYSGPQQQQNNQYLPPNNQQQNNQYLPPQNNQYLPPNQQQQNNQYLPPKNNQYLPPQNNQYLPPQNQQNQGYSGPQQQNNQYLPPQKQNNQYLPPSQPSNYGYSKSPSIEYLPTRGYTPGPPPRYSSRPVTVEHWPAKYDYEAPTSPRSLYSVTPARPYGPPTGYQHQTNYRGPPNREYLPAASPTTSSLSYSTIPVQTPPPQEGNYGSGSYRNPVNVKVEFFQVPLVTSSHSHAPNNYKR